MRILLLNPVTLSGQKFIRMCRNHRPGAGDTGSWPPIDLAEIAAVLRRGGFQQLKILDSVILGQTFKKMINAILSFAPDLIIVHNITPGLYYDKEMAKLVKEKAPDTKIAFFGLHASSRPEDILSQEIEFAIKDEPAYTALELAGCLKYGEEKNLHSVKGLSFFSNGRRSHNPDRPPEVDLDNLPMPARELLDNRRYILADKGVPFTIIRTSRGCPYSCIYCSAGADSKNIWRSRSPQSILAEIKEVRKTFGINDFMFFSDTFTVKEKDILGLCALIRKDAPGIRWLCNSRTDTITQAMALAMKNSGCWLVSLGVESGDEAILRNIKKGASLEDARRSVDILRKAGIKSIGYYMFGLPGETPQTIDKTIAFSRELDTDYAYFFTATPLPGTAYFDIARQRRWLVSEDWRRYHQGSSNLISFETLSSRAISRSIPKAYLSFYLRPARIIRECREIKNIRSIFQRIRIGCRILAGNF